ncbi:hypothetical protein J5681_02875 [bacterium]|nr:hypothetical protein [bacterium]
MDRGNFAEFVISPLLKNTAPVTVNAQIQIFHLFAGKIIFEDPAGYFELSNHFEFQLTSNRRRGGVLNVKYSFSAYCQDLFDEYLRKHEI